MTDKPIDLKKAREARASEVVNDLPTMKPVVDPADYFAGVMEQNRKAAAKAVEDKRQRNKLTKQRYRIKDTEK